MWLTGTKRPRLRGEVVQYAQTVYDRVKKARKAGGWEKLTKAKFWISLISDRYAEEVGMANATPGWLKTKCAVSGSVETEMDVIY